MPTPSGPDAITGVVFDFHGTLVDVQEPADWIAAARRLLADRGRPWPYADTAELRRLAAHLHDVWDHATTLDPTSARDLSRERHREVFTQAVGLFPGTQPGTDLIDALYVAMPRLWLPFDDTLPTLRALKARGLRIVLLSNIGVDIRDQLASTGLADLLDDVVLSYEVGLVKPDPGIFAHALERLGRPAGQTLMVGDSPHADVGGAPLGIRTLILPRAPGRIRGLDAVLRLVG
jgi:HAD superfamily hydrolase (TIGR01509 family)